MQAYADLGPDSTTDDYTQLYKSLGDQYQPEKLLLGTKLARLLAASLGFLILSILHALRALSTISDTGQLASAAMM